MCGRILTIFDGVIRYQTESLANSTPGIQIDLPTHLLPYMSNREKTYCMCDQELTYPVHVAG